MKLAHQTEHLIILIDLMYQSGKEDNVWKVRAKFGIWPIGCSSHLSSQIRFATTSLAILLQFEASYWRKGAKSVVASS